MPILLNMYTSSPEMSQIKSITRSYISLIFVLVFTNSRIVSDEKCND